MWNARRRLNLSLSTILYTNYAVVVAGLFWGRRATAGSEQQVKDPIRIKAHGC